MPVVPSRLTREHSFSFKLFCVRNNLILLFWEQNAGLIMLLLSEEAENDIQQLHGFFALIRLAAFLLKKEKNIMY